MEKSALLSSGAAEALSSRHDRLWVFQLRHLAIIDRRSLQLFDLYQEANAILHIDENLLSITKKDGRSSHAGDAFCQTVISVRNRSAYATFHDVIDLEGSAKTDSGTVTAAYAWTGARCVCDDYGRVWRQPPRLS